MLLKLWNILLCWRMAWWSMMCYVIWKVLVCIVIKFFFNEIAKKNSLKFGNYLVSDFNLFVCLLLPLHLFIILFIILNRVYFFFFGEVAIGCWLHVPDGTVLDSYIKFQLCSLCDAKFDHRNRKHKILPSWINKCSHIFFHILN